MDISASVSSSASSATGPTSFGNVYQSGGNTGISGVMVAVIIGSLLVVGGLFFYLNKK